VAPGAKAAIGNKKGPVNKVAPIEKESLGGTEALGEKVLAQDPTKLLPVFEKRKWFLKNKVEWTNADVESMLSKWMD
jgi:hypothetical protein